MVIIILDDVELQLTKILMKNPRVSILRISNLLGLNYISLRERLRKLQRNGLIDFKLAVSPLLVGDVAGVVRIKNKDVSKVIEKALKCNRVISAMMLNGEEALLITYGRSKDDIAFLVSYLTSETSDVVEVNIDYGRIPHGEKIALKNPEPRCAQRSEAPIKCNECIPVLRGRNRNSNLGENNIAV